MTLSDYPAADHHYPHRARQRRCQLKAKCSQEDRFITASSATGVDWGEVERSAETKRATRGSFERGVVLVETSWPKRGERLEALAPENIKLAQLSRPVSRGVVHEVAFSSLLAEGGDRSIALNNGTILTISMSDTGVKIEEGEPKVVSPWQLPLRFDQP